jgi:hypothetical protein
MVEYLQHNWVVQGIYLLKEERLDPHPCPFLCPHLLGCSSMQHSGNANQILNRYHTNCSVMMMKTILFNMRFEVLIAVKTSMLVFCVVISCGLVCRYQCSRGTYCLHLQGFRLKL